MTTHKKDRTGRNRAAFSTSTQSCNFTGLVTRIKAIIVTMALWGLLPIPLADWLINRGESHDE